MHSHLINLKYRLHGEDKRKLWLFKKWILQNGSFNQIIPRYLQMFLQGASPVSLVFLLQHHRLVWLTYCEFPDGCNLIYTHFYNPLHSGWHIVWVLGKKQYTVNILDRESTKKLFITYIYWIPAISWATCTYLQQQNEALNYLPVNRLRRKMVYYLITFSASHKWKYSTKAMIHLFVSEIQYDFESKMPLGGLIPCAREMKSENLAASALLDLFIPGSLFLLSVIL